MAEPTFSVGRLTWSGATTKAMDASWNSDVVFIGPHAGFSVDAVWTGSNSPDGTLKLQGSNGASWNDIPNQSKAVSGAGSHMFKVGEYYAVFTQFRLVYTSSSGGSGDTILAIYVIK